MVQRGITCFQAQFQQVFIFLQQKMSVVHFFPQINNAEEHFSLCPENYCQQYIKFVFLSITI